MNPCLITETTLPHYCDCICRRLEGNAPGVMLRLDRYLSYGWKIVPESGVVSFRNTFAYREVSVYKEEERTS